MACCIVLLTAAHAACLVARFGFEHDELLGLVPLLDLNGEMNLPTLYASASLALCACLAAACAEARRQRRASCVPAWWALSLALAFMAFDEYVGLHERLSRPLRAALGLDGLLHNAWVLPYGVAALLATLAAIPFLRRLPASTRRGFLAAGSVFVVGALGVEMLSGPVREAAGDVTSLPFALLATLEELCEMLGVLLCARTLARHLVEHEGGGVLRLGGAGSARDGAGHASDGRDDATDGARSASDEAAPATPARRAARRMTRWRGPAPR